MPTKGHNRPPARIDMTPVLDGRIHLYRRTDVTDNSNWHFRFSITENGKHKYVARSARTHRFQIAEQTAIQEYFAVQTKQAHGIPVFAQSFLDLCDKALERLRNDVKLGKAAQSRLNDAERTYSLYASRFFRGRNVNEITQDVVDEYWDWRLAFWTTDEGQRVREDEGIRRISLNPSKETLAHETVLYKMAFDIAERQGAFQSGTRPDWRVPIKRRGKKEYPFTPHPWRKIIWFFENHWLKVEGEKYQHKRKMLYYFCRTFADTGARPGALHSLQWRNVQLVEDEHGNQHTLFYVQGKDHTYEPVAGPELFELLKEWRNDPINPHTGDDDLVFADLSGKRAKAGDFGTRFKNMLKNAEKNPGSKGVQLDPEGKPFHLYCIRHTYATYQIRYNARTFEWLATQMGTSIKMLEKHYINIKPIQGANWSNVKSINDAPKTDQFDRLFVEVGDEDAA